jgi:hypothetical protein
MANGHEDEHGAGWILFAGVMIVIAGVMNTVGGIAAIDSANFYTDNAHFMVSDLNTWGWVILVIGVLQLFAGFSIWSGGAYGRWVGVGSASLNAIAQLMFIAAFPLWSLAIFSIDILVIYGLVVYGGRHGAAAGRRPAA